MHQFVIVHCGWKKASFTHMIQNYVTGTGTITTHTIVPVPVKQPWRI